MKTRRAVQIEGVLLDSIPEFFKTVRAPHLEPSLRENPFS
jgi:hypothetical protein